MKHFYFLHRLFLKACKLNFNKLIFLVNEIKSFWLPTTCRANFFCILIILKKYFSMLKNTKKCFSKESVLLFENVWQSVKTLFNVHHLNDWVSCWYYPLLLEQNTSKDIYLTAKYFSHLHFSIFLCFLDRPTSYWSDNF